MNKIKTFFYSFKNSLSNRAYYKDILQVPFAFSWKYLYFFSFLIVLIVALQIVVMGAIGLPALKPTLQTFKTEAAKAYPPELEVEVKNGILTTNVEQPYFIDVPAIQQATNEDPQKAQPYDHFITIDTTASVEDYMSYKTIVLLTETAMVYPDRNNGALQTYSVMNFSDFQEPIVMNKEIFDGLLQQAGPFIDMIPTIAAVLLVVSLMLTPLMGLFLAGWYMLYLSIVTVITWVIARLFKTHLTYGKLYQLGMHAITLPIIVTYILGLLGTQMNFLFTAIFCLWMALILSQLDDVVKPAVEVSKDLNAPKTESKDARDQKSE